MTFDSKWKIFAGCGTPTESTCSEKKIQELLYFRGIPDNQAIYTILDLPVWVPNGSEKRVSIYHPLGP